MIYYLCRHGRQRAEQVRRVHYGDFLVAEGQGRRSFGRRDVVRGLVALRSIVRVDRLLDRMSRRCLESLDLPVHQRFLIRVLFVFDWRARLANRCCRLLFLRFLDNNRFLKRRAPRYCFCRTELGLRLGTARILQRHHILCKSRRRCSRVSQTSKGSVIIIFTLYLRLACPEELRLISP